MTITTRLVTFGAGPVQFPADIPSGLSRVRAEPLRSNAHVSYVGTSAVTNDGTGTGVITELAVPSVATAPCDSFNVENQDSDDSINPTQFWAHGTAGEKLKVTYYQN